MIKKSKERIKKTGEVFTPMDLCLRMVREIPEKTLKDPTSTYLDPACGDGNFLVALLQILTEEYGHDRDQVLSRLFGVELMYDNVEEALRRLGGGKIVCADALTFNFDQLTK